MTLRVFPKSGRLCSRKAIEALFAGGNRAFSAFPLRVVYRVNAEPQPHSPLSPASPFSTQVLISVSKRHFKHAVDRNRAKRQIRESWRLNKEILSPSPGSVSDGLSVGTPPAAIGSNSLQPPSLHLAFIWLSDEPQSTDLVQRKMKNLLHRIKEEVQLFTEQRTNGLTD